MQAPYFARCQRPDRVEPGLKAAQGRLKDSWEALAGAGASPRERRDLAWAQALLPPTMGGAGIHDTLALRGAAYAASYIACWPTLQRVCPALAGEEFASSTLPSTAAARRRAYEEARTVRGEVAEGCAHIRDVYSTFSTQGKVPRSHTTKQ